MDIKNQECSDSSPESTYSPALKLSDDFISMVESALRGEETTYGATPFDKLVSLASQKEVLSNRQRLVHNIPDNLPMIIANYVQETFNNRFWARLAANDENFVTRLLHKNLLDADPRLHPMIDRGRFGKASPTELMLIRDQLGIRSLEVACLTHPYGENLEEQLPQMTKSVRAGVEILGGQYDVDAEPRYAVKEVLRDETGKPVAVLMTRKRDVGTVPNGSDDESSAIVRERLSFILRIDAGSRFGQLHHDEQVVNQFASIAGKNKEVQQEMLQQFNSTISMFLQFKVFEEAIPVATTTYVFDRRTTTLVEEALGRAPERETEQEFIATNFVDEKQANEVQERLERITKSFQHEVYKSVNISTDPL